MKFWYVGQRVTHLPQTARCLADMNLFVISAYVSSNLSQVSTTYMDGYRATAVSPFIGPRAAEKAAKNADAILKRLVTQSLGLVE